MVIRPLPFFSAAIIRTRQSCVGLFGLGGGMSVPSAIMFYSDNDTLISADQELKVVSFKNGLVRMSNKEIRKGSIKDPCRLNRCAVANSLC